ncbi:MAG: ABC transporter ATP-binding protein [bacterium]|nr:ABC transporter ATP-binding protein [bacterium]
MYQQNGTALRANGIVKRFVKEEENGKKFWPPKFLRKREKFAALNGIDLEVKTGEIFGLIGMNGSGKSTFIRLISTLLYPDEGSVEVYGIDVTKDPIAVRKMINRVSVDAAFFRSLTAKENLRYSARLYGLSPKEANEKYKNILSRIGFDVERVNDQVKSLSRGMKQKVAVSRALMSTPQLLLLDEPTTGLDPRSKLEVQKFLKEMQSEGGTTILISTHDMEEAERICGRIAIIHEGEIVARGTAQELKNAVREGAKSEPTMEEVFIHYTDTEWKDAIEDV